MSLHVITKSLHIINNSLHVTKKSPHVTRKSHSTSIKTHPMSSNSHWTVSKNTYVYSSSREGSKLHRAQSHVPSKFQYVVFGWVDVVCVGGSDRLCLCFGRPAWVCIPCCSVWVHLTFEVKACVLGFDSLPLLLEMCRQLVLTACQVGHVCNNLIWACVTVCCAGDDKKKVIHTRQHTRQ